MSSVQAVAGGARVRKQIVRIHILALWLKASVKEARHTEVINVEEHDDARKQQLQLALDDGALILPGAPNVAPVTTHGMRLACGCEEKWFVSMGAQKEMVAFALAEEQLWWLHRACVT